MTTKELQSYLDLAVFLLKELKTIDFSGLPEVIKKLDPVLFALTDAATAAKVSVFVKRAVKLVNILKDADELIEKLEKLSKRRLLLAAIAKLI